MGSSRTGTGESDAVLEMLDRIGRFLQTHRLGPEPLNYEFAYKVLVNPKGPLAEAVAALTDGGFRLTRNDIISLGAEVATAAPPDQSDSHEQKAHDALVEQTQHHVDGFHALVSSVHAETSGFGRDLAAQAVAIREVGGAESAALSTITGAMIARVQSAESKLEAATREAAELREKLDEARDKARRDPLTSLPNRRGFEEAYDAALAAKAKICLAICDVDKFKMVNDGFGHAVGDRVLKAIGEVIATECDGHLVARYGGEEFVVLFTGVSLEAAHDLLEAARATVSRKRYRLRETDAPLGAVTFSAGLTRANSGETRAQTLDRADRLLYRAKDEGRNRINFG